MKLFLSLFLLSPFLLMSLPKDMQIKHGQINAESKLRELIIRQASKNGIINWSEFSIGEKEKVLFSLPNGDSKTLNRVIGDNLSEINGKLSSNGTIYLINQNGILIGPNGSIQTKGFVGSTLDLSNEDFLSKSQKFYGTSAATIENNGLIETDGNVCLFAKELINQGLINSKKGNVYLLSSNELIYQPQAREEIYYKIPINDPEEGSIGKVSNSGIIEADTLQEVDGRIYLVAKDGDAEVRGDLKAQEIRVLGKKSLVYESANIDASGENGGTILIGGDYKGETPEVQNANLTWVAKGASIKADGTNGDGGKIICWSDYATYMHGSLSAKSQSNGDGGFIEISSPYTLGYSGDVNATSMNGKTGTVLFDPSDITISGGATNPPFPTTAGPPTDFYNPGVALANLNVTDLQNALNGGNNVTIQTSAGVFRDGDVTFATNVSWSTATTLTVQADRSVIINAGITLSSTNAGANFTAFDLRGNEAGTATGNFSGVSIPGGAITTVNGNINLVGIGGDTIVDHGISISSFGEVSSTGSGVNAGTITLNGTGSSLGDIGIRSGIFISQGTITSVDGNISLTGQGGAATTEGSNIGIRIIVGSIIQSTGTGANAATITLNGTGGSGTTSNNGITYATSTITSVDGNISLTGQAGAGSSSNNVGILITSSSITSTGVGVDAATITLDGTGSGTDGGRGISANTVTLSSVDGDISLTGSSNASLSGADGMAFNTLNVTSTGTGSITADGTGGAGGGSGIELFTNAGFTTNSGNISLTGAGVSPDEGLDMTDVSAFVNSTSGDITITANTIDLAGSTASSGALTIQPNTVAGTIGLGTGSTGTLNLDATELGNITNGFSSITFGRTDGTGAVDMRAFTYLDPIIVYGSTITTNGAIVAGANDVTFNVGPASAGTLNLDNSVTTTGTFSINGGASNDDFNINVTGQTATLNGNGGTNTLSGPNAVNSWTITAYNAGTLDFITFSNIQNLVGGNEADSFLFADGQGLDGYINGGAPAAPNTLNYSAFTTPVTINLITPTSGTASNLGSGFSNIGNIIGNVIIGGPFLAKFNSLKTELFLTLHEVRRFRLIEEFSWLQFNDPILWLLDLEKLRSRFIVDKISVERIK